MRNGKDGGGYELVEYVEDGDFGHCYFCGAKADTAFRGLALPRQFPPEQAKWITDALVCAGLYDEERQEPKADAFPCICESCVVLFHMRFMEDRFGQEAESRGSADTDVTPKKVYAVLQASVVGQDRAKRALSVAVWKHHRRLLSQEVPPVEEELEQDDVPEIEKTNVMLIGPSGCGKTLLAKTVAQWLGVPVVELDATDVTSAGYVGGKASDCLKRLYMEADSDLELAQCGVVILDEVDKIVASDSSGGKDVGGAGAQQSLLKLVEGAKVPIKVGRGDHECEITFDTSNVLFIACGAFPGLSKRISGRLHKKAMGFGDTSGPKLSDDELLKKVHVDDLVAYGLLKEFCGRFPVIATLDELTRPELLRILTEPKQAVVRQARKLLSDIGVQLTVVPEVLEHLVDDAIRRKTGARGLASALEECLQKTLFEVPDTKLEDERLSRVLISVATLSGGEPEYVYDGQAPLVATVERKG